MAEYIEQEKVIHEIDTWLDSVGTVLVGKGLSYYGELLGCVEDVPAADVAPVRHGQWEQCFEDWRRQIEGNKCTACGFEHYGSCINYYHYCPNCGVKMDGGETP